MDKVTYWIGRASEEAKRGGDKDAGVIYALSAIAEAIQTGNLIAALVADRQAHLDAAKTGRPPVKIPRPGA